MVMGHSKSVRELSRAEYVYEGAGSRKPEVSEGPRFGYRVLCRRRYSPRQPPPRTGIIVIKYTVSGPLGQRFSPQTASVIT